jgi:hypothetical protein
MRYEDAVLVPADAFVVEWRGRMGRGGSQVLVLTL